MNASSAAPARPAAPKGEIMPFRFGLPAVLLAGLLLSACASRSADGWVLLGERTVNDRAETDEIFVGPGRGSFDAIRIEVRRAPIRFYDMKVHYGNGSVQDVELRDVLSAGSYSRVIDLRGDERAIRRVIFRYEARSPGRRRAVIRLYGRK
jgi:hypothetical protein